VRSGTRRFGQKIVAVHYRVGGTATELDWTGIEQAIGLRCPAEFRELCSLFPPGVFRAS
jgi:hypothetical protein